MNIDNRGRYFHLFSSSRYAVVESARFRYREAISGLCPVVFGLFHLPNQSDRTHLHL